MLNKVQLPEDQEVFRLIEVCRLARIQPNMLRFWGTEFDQMETQENENGEFLFARKQVELVLKIRRLLVDEHLSIVNARKRIASLRETRPGLEVVPRPARKNCAKLVREAKNPAKQVSSAPSRARQEAEIAKEVEQRLEPLISTLSDLHPDLAKIIDRT